MKHVQLNTSRRLGLGALVASLAMTFATASQGTQTDIASTPIVTTTAALVKPNIMLLMDASGSMARTHMPDEVETETRPNSVGYKSAQCNVLYYNPTQVYFLPKRYDGTPFPIPSYSSAPYSGFGSYFAIPNLTTTDLRSQFVAFDNTTLNEAPAFPDTPQAGYYYVYTGPEPLSFHGAPCNQGDTGATATTPGGGTWTKYNVNLLSPAEQQNFAIWYSFYRTRISLIKSAASLAFSPLNDTKRVGFITVEPKDTPESPAINPVRYLPLNDFNSTQKNLWFTKIFSQVPGGASPAREGLARVGRYYGGKEDSINAGMAATGTADPVQYSCQQNFTIMTTDGYWNGQTESPGGGGLNLDGTALVGQQDGVRSDPYSPPPMWDGTSATTRVVTNKTNAYSDNVCSLGGRYRSTFQTQRQVSNLTKDTSRTTKRTVQFTQSTQQSVATTTQTTKTVTQTTQTTQQFALRKVHYHEERYQHIKSQEQTTQVTEQYQLQTSQVVAQTFQTRRLQTQTWQTQEQWQTAKSQNVSTTTQYVTEKDQYKQGKTQILQRQYQLIAYNHSIEHGDGVAGPCTASHGNYPIECRVKDAYCVSHPTVGHCASDPYVPTVGDVIAQLVDPATCTTGPGPTIGRGPSFLRTICDPGPEAMPYQAVPSCTPGTTTANSGNNWVASTCDLLVVDPPAAINGTCSADAQGAGPDYFLYKCTRPPANNTSTPVASCGASTPGTSPDWITTTCSQPAGPNNQAATPSLPCTVQSTTTTDGSYVTTTCTKPIDTAGYAASCSPDSGLTGPSYLKVTCNPTTLGNDPIASASCAPSVGAGPGFVVTTCPRAPAGPQAVAAPVQSCANGASSNAPDYFETTCTNPPANNQTAFVTAADCAPYGTTAGTSPDWITRVCSKPPGINNQTNYADPNLCIADDGSRFPFLKVTCTPAPVMPATVVDPTTCPLGPPTVGAGPAYIVTHCDKRDVAPPVDVHSCVSNTDAVTFVVTVCGYVQTDTPVAFCVLGPLPDDGVDAVTCVNPAGPGNAVTNVATCNPQSGTSPDFVTVTCSGPNPISSGFVDPANCTNNVGPAPNVYVTTCSTVPVGPYLSPTAVPSPCASGMDSNFVVTTCSSPVGTNTPDTPSAPCQEGSNTDGSYITTTCTKHDRTDYVQTSSCSEVIQTGSGPAITCNTVPTLGTPALNCARGSVDGPPYFDTTTDCHSNITSPMADYAGICTDGPDGTPGELVTCNLRPIDVFVSDSGCLDGTDPSTGLVTQCSTQSGGGHKYSVQLTTTVTTTPYSGTVATGPSVPVTTLGPVTPVNNTCYPTPQTFTDQPPVDVAGCTAWPCTVDTPNPNAGSTNSLADVSEYYYRTDLRPLMVDNVPSAGNGVEDDNTPHQHMTTFAIGLGVSGALTYQSNYRSLSTTTGDFADIRTTAKRWPLWPDPAVDYTNSDNYNNPKSIDDYWHTAVNGRGMYFSATNPTSVIDGLGNALARIDSVLASGAPIGTSTLQPVAGNNFAYATSYQSGVWAGDVQASLIDLATGLPTTPVWSANALLAARTGATCDDRSIFVMRGSAPMGQFTWQTVLCPGGVPASPTTDLTPTEMAFFGPLNVSLLSQFPYMTDGTSGTALQQQAAQAPGALVNFLRGQRANEDFHSNSATQLFRARSLPTGTVNVLGDIVGSQPVYVSEPFADYQENNYSAFKTANASRTPMIYVGANDGMLHAFYATVDLLNIHHGQEAWAVIPSPMLRNMYKLADDNYKRDGHQFFVDATPVVGDVWNGSQWRTILVGGFNAGGKGYFALDVTTPGVPPLPLWEFKQDSASCPSASPAVMPSNVIGDCNLGFSFGKPVITKLANQWVVIVSSGYNNINGVAGDGGGFLYVIDALTGRLITKIATSAGDSGTPSGLAQLSNYVDNVLLDNTTLRAYGGDVLGNMWRFDFAPAPAVTLLGIAKDPLNNLEPITVRPELAELDGNPFVMFGTGRLLGATDVTDTHTQSVFGFRDPLIGPSPIYADPIRSFLKPMKITEAAPTTPGDLSTAARTISCVGSAGECGRPAGWVLDLAEPGERVNVEMKLVLGALVFASNVPEAVPCSVGGHSWFNQIDYRTGAPIPNATTSSYLSDSINVGFTVLQLPVPTGDNNPQYVGVFRQGKADTYLKNVTPPPPLPTGKRISWREIAQ